MNIIIQLIDNNSLYLFSMYNIIVLSLIYYHLMKNKILFKNADTFFFTSIFMFNWAVLYFNFELYSFQGLVYTATAAIAYTQIGKLQLITKQKKVI